LMIRWETASSDCDEEQLDVLVAKAAQEVHERCLKSIPRSEDTDLEFLTPWKIAAQEASRWKGVAQASCQDASNCLGSMESQRRGLTAR
jgi:hypothetical protein